MTAATGHRQRGNVMSKLRPSTRKKTKGQIIAMTQARWRDRGVKVSLKPEPWAKSMADEFRLAPTDRVPKQENPRATQRSASRENYLQVVDLLKSGPLHVNEIAKRLGKSSKGASDAALYAKGRGLVQHVKGKRAVYELKESDETAR